MGRRVYATVAAKLGIGCGDVPVAPLADDDELNINPPTPCQ